MMFDSLDARVKHNCNNVFQGVVAGGRRAAAAVRGDHGVGSDYIDAVWSPQQLPG